MIENRKDSVKMSFSSRYNQTSEENVSGGVWKAGIN